MTNIIKKKILIFIIVFIITGIFVVGFMYFSKKHIKINICQNEALLSKEREHKLCQSINLNKLNDKEKSIKIGNIIKNEVNSKFNISDYVVDISESGSDEDIIKIYDYTFAIAGAKTNIGYVVFVDEKNSIIKSVFDNMNGYNASLLKENNESSIKNKIKNLTDSKKEKIRNKALEVPDGSEYIKEITNESYRYDIEENKLYYVIFYEGKYQFRGNSDFESPMYSDIYEVEI